jgi:hypothetical protein
MTSVVWVVACSRPQLCESCTVPIARCPRPPTPRTVRACRAPAIMFGMPTRFRCACITGPPSDVLSRAYGVLGAPGLRLSGTPGTCDGLSAAHVHVILVTLDDREQGCACAGPVGLLATRWRGERWAYACVPVGHARGCRSYPGRVKVY